VQSAAGSILPAWQAERESILQHVCTRIASRGKFSGSLSSNILRYSRLYHGRPFKSHPALKLHLQPGTLVNLWYRWRRGGEVPSAFRLRYAPQHLPVPAALLIRFVEFCACARWPSLRDAWTAFETRGGRFSRGRAVSRLPIRYEQLRYWFSGGDFNDLQNQLKARHEAETELGRLRLSFATKIRACVPAKEPRRPARKAAGYEI
jgi:hypothetical protein